MAIMSLDECGQQLISNMSLLYSFFFLLFFSYLFEKLIESVYGSSHNNPGLSKCCQLITLILFYYEH